MRFPRPTLPAGVPAAVPAVAALAFLVAGSTAAATDRLQAFRTVELVPVAFDADALLALPDLDEGAADDRADVEVTGDGMRTVADASAAEAATGLRVPEVAALPDGVVADPVLRVGGPLTATVTLRDPGPDGTDRDGADLDGTVLELVAGPGVAAVWPGGTGFPALVVGRSVAPTASATGAALDDAIEHLAGAPGVPADLAASLRAIAAGGGALPLPIPSGLVDTASVEVGGAPATLLSARDGTATAVVWVEDGLIQLVAGTLRADEVLDVAEHLR